jgi:hypothetical protein
MKNNKAEENREMISQNQEYDIVLLYLHQFRDFECSYYGFIHITVLFNTGNPCTCYPYLHCSESFDLFGLLSLIICREIIIIFCHFQY